MSVSLLLSLLLFQLQSPPVRHVAVLEFENITMEKSYDWIGTGIAELFTARLGRLPTFTLVERRHLNSVLRELKFNRSQFVDPRTAQHVGKAVGADMIVVGSYQKFQDQIRIVARAVEVPSTAVRSSAVVEGPYKDFLKLQADLAAKMIDDMKLTLAEQDRRGLASGPVNNVAALEAFSDGVYFYRNEMISDAAALFDRAIALEPNYAGAHFYKGLVFEKLNRWDDAIAEFRRALPRAEPEEPMPWSWDVPFTSNRSNRGKISGLDTNELNLQRYALDHDTRGLTARWHKRVAYGEHVGKNTVLHVLDLESRKPQRVEIENVKMDLNTTSIASDQLTVLTSGAAFEGGRMPESIGLHGLYADEGSVAWRRNVVSFGDQYPIAGIASNVTYVSTPANGRIVALDKGNVIWIRDGLPLDRFGPPELRTTKTNGKVIIAKTNKAIHALRLSDGADAWVRTPESARFTHIVADGAVVVFEPDRGITIVDLETGENRLQIPVPQQSQDMRLGAGAVRVSAATVRDGTLYFQSKSRELYAAGLDGTVLWHTALKTELRSLGVDADHVYAATDSGELWILDKASGAVKATQKISSKPIRVDYAGAEAIVVSSGSMVYARDPGTGRKRWEYPVRFSPRVVMYFKGAVIVRTSSTQVAALDAAAGDLLWQYAGKDTPAFFFTTDAFFLVEETGVKEYVLGGSRQTLYDRPGNREVLTELASSLVSKGDLEGAQTLLAQASAKIDPNYAPMRAVRARLEKAKGNRLEAARELAAYANLAGAESEGGREAIAELKESHGLVWYQLLDAAVYGVPAIVGGQLINSGRSNTGNRQIIALNAENGASLWRIAPGRFSDVVFDPPTGRAWLVSGDGEDSSAVIVYAVDVRAAGERKELARWKRPGPVDFAAIAYAHERLFIVTVSADPAASHVAVAIDAVSTSGEKLWNHTDASRRSSIEAQLPLGVFAPLGDSLVYSNGQDLWKLSAGDGTAAHQYHAAALIMPRLLRNLPGDSKLQFVNARNEVAVYDAVTGTTTTHGFLPEDTIVYLPAKGAVYGTNGSSVFAFQFASGEAVPAPAWRAEPGKDRRFIGLLESGAALWAMTNDSTLVELDPATGKMLSEHPTLWPASGLHIEGKTLYAFTSDRAAFALRLR